MKYPPTAVGGIRECDLSPNGRLEIESDIKRLKADFARFGPEEERLRNREALLETDLQTSQARLNELNSQLDALFNEMKTP